MPLPRASSKHLDPWGKAEQLTGSERVPGPLTPATDDDPGLLCESQAAVLNVLKSRHCVVSTVHTELDPACFKQGFVLGDEKGVRLLQCHSEIACIVGGQPVVL